MEKWQNLLQLFKQAVLNLDPDFAPWLDWFEQRVQGKPITTTELRIWVDYPAEKAAQGPRALYAYMLPQFRQQAQLQFKRLRAIFIGAGYAGKTSLVRALHGEDIHEEEELTQGVEIREWVGMDEGVIVHCWDFGGQVILHAIHQFFLRSACLYILVLDARPEKNATEEAEYWLQFIQSYGAGAPVLLVGNKYDVMPVRLDLPSLQIKYPNIINFYDLACKDALGGSHQALFTRFKDAFCHEIQQMALHQAKFTAPQFVVLQAVRELARQQSCLQRSQFDVLCDEQNILGEEKEVFLEFLDNLGVITHFAQIPFMARLCTRSSLVDLRCICINVW